MTQRYVLIVPYKQFPAGIVLEPGAMLGDTLVRNSKAIPISKEQVNKLAKRAYRGALPRVPEAQLAALVARAAAPAE